MQQMLFVVNLLNSFSDQFNSRQSYSFQDFVLDKMLTVLIFIKSVLFNTDTKETGVIACITEASAVQ